MENMGSSSNSIGDDEIDDDDFSCGVSFTLLKNGDLVFDAVWGNEEEDCPRLGILLRAIKDSSLIEDNMVNMETTKPEDIDIIMKAFNLLGASEPAMSPLDVFRE